MVFKHRSLTCPSVCWRVLVFVGGTGRPGEGRWLWFRAIPDKGEEGSDNSWFSLTNYNYRKPICIGGKGDGGGGGGVEWGGGGGATLRMQISRFLFSRKYRGKLSERGNKDLKVLKYMHYKTKTFIQVLFVLVLLILLALAVLQQKTLKKLDFMKIAFQFSRTSSCTKHKFRACSLCEN